VRGCRAVAWKVEVYGPKPNPERDQKLRCSGRAEAIAYARQRGWLDERLIKSDYLTG